MFPTVGLGMAGSADLQLPDGLDSRYRRAWDTLTEAEEGDYVIYDEDSREAALEVLESTDVEENRILVKGAGGARIEITGSVNPNGSPAIRTSNNEKAMDLRFATSEEIHDYLEAQPEDHPDKDLLDSTVPDELEGEADEENNVDSLSDYSDADDVPMSVGDLRREGPPEGTDYEDFAIGETPGQRWPPERKDGDTYVSELSDDPSMDWSEFQEESNVPEDADNDSIIDHIFGDSEPSWTFVDELLHLGYDVSKTVNNWHLIDYGIVTEDNLDDYRQAAWYNIETEEVVLLGAKKTDGEVRFFVYHIEDDAEEVEPVFDSSEPADAIGKVNDILYSSFNDDEAEITIEENPATDDVTVYDALTNMAIVRALARAGNSDPYGMRTYISETTLPQFIKDADDAMVAFYEFLVGASQSVADAWLAFVNGAGLPTRQRIRAFLNGIDVEELGKDTRAAIVSAAQGIRRDFLGVEVQPVIKYNELGIDVQYKYKGAGSGGSGPEARLSIDPRRRVPKEDDEGEIVTDEAGNPVYTTEGFLGDGLLPSGLDYVALVNAADWLDVNNRRFIIPDPWADDSKVEFRVADAGRYTGDSGRQRDPTARSSSKTGIQAAPTLERWREWDDERLDELLFKYQDDKEKQKFLIYIATLEQMLETFDNRDEDVDEIGWERFKQLAGNPRVTYEDVWDEHGFSKGDLRFEVFHQAVDLVQRKDVDPVDAISQAIGENDDNSATAGDFDDISFKHDGGSDGGDEDDEPPLPPGVGEAAQEPGEMTEDDRALAGRLARELESGDLDPDELTDEDRQVLSEAHAEEGLLSEDVAEELGYIRSGGDGGDMETVDDDVEEMMQHLHNSPMAQQDAQERAETVGDYYQQNPGERPGDPAEDDTL